VYKRQIPQVKDEESLIRFADHFPYIDILKDRYNSPYQYADGDIRELVEKAVEEGKIVSAYVRGLVWVSYGNYPLLWTIFRKKAELNDTDRKVLAACNGRSFSDLRSDLNLDENTLKNVIAKLESSYLIRRKMK